MWRHTRIMSKFWRKRYRSHDLELTRLRRENKQLKLERDILAKATAWFAGKNGGASTSSSNS